MATGLALALSLAGTAVSAIGTIATGQAEARAAEMRARQEELNAQNEFAAGQRDAMDVAHQQKLALSRLQNNAASGGFTGTDPTALDLTGEVAAHGTYQQQVAIYGGANRAAGLRAQAAADRASGQAALTGSYFRAGGTLLSGFSGALRDKYGFGAPMITNETGASQSGLIGTVFGWG